VKMRADRRLVQGRHRHRARIVDSRAVQEDGRLSPAQRCGVFRHQLLRADHFCARVEWMLFQCLRYAPRSAVIAAQRVAIRQHQRAFAKPVILYKPR